MFVQHLFVAAVATLMLLSVNACSRYTGPTLSAPEAFAQAEAGKLTLIDIRRPDEWKTTGVGKDAILINMDNSQGNIGFTRQVASAVNNDKNAPIGLICRTGNRTSRMQEVLHDAGYTHVYNIKEGMVGSAAGPGWIARGLPVIPCPSC